MALLKNWGECMDEIITEERKQGLIEMFTAVAEQNVLTNMDALTIIQVLEDACRRKAAEIDENIMSALIEGDDDE